jgi:hypothetical protein
MLKSEYLESARNARWWQLVRLTNKTNSVALARKRTMPTERPPFVGEVSARFCGYRVSRGHRNGSPRPYSRFYRPEILLTVSTNFEHSENNLVSMRLSFGVTNYKRVFLATRWDAESWLVSKKASEILWHVSGFCNSCGNWFLSAPAR